VGTARLIQKSEEEDKLPVETLFPEAFTESAATTGSVEASRFIARHADKMTQHTISLSLMRTMAAQAHAQGADYIYAVIEGHLARLFTNVGMPFEQIAEAKAIAEYDNTMNMAVRFDPKEIFKVVEKDIKKEKIISTFFEDALVSLGVGYYDETLISPIS
jgi:N-acyl-L-homoserine lactone synthetase